jgi:hypothetical protein
MQPFNLASDHLGHVYVADDSNFRVRMIDPAGIITTIAGNGSFGYSGDGGQATNASLNAACWVTADGTGNVYLSGFTGFHHIRKINASGIISTFAGSPLISGLGGDGGLASAAFFFNPEGMAVDNAGNIYVCDFLRRVRKIDPSGIITLFAGNGSPGYSGDGGPATAAQLSAPRSVTTDGEGNVYISDKFSSVIRRVNPAGIISTYAGTGVMGFSGDGGTATLARLSDIEQIVTDTSGNLFVCDLSNSRIRKINSAGIITTLAGGGGTGTGGMADPRQPAACIFLTA